MFANAAVLTLLEQDSMTGDALDRERGADALPDTWWKHDEIVGQILNEIMQSVFRTRSEPSVSR